ncbi:bacterial sugar transferase [Campylobacter rectus RM3267]|uniref:Sugar transferase n=2 Tax=Campylobacter rectus TaxID=203 RepID=A0A6G5QLS2_CAMRE|nr:sugar transferase [Campylobacter rectus]EEF13252.1 bacterial sugar transferase [Campylobacter rectus RM3267]QCD46532.1 sugar transferase [Campylobacter rectus]UEB47233.1 sugar transferase [Campylobacter rectus]
MNLRSKILLKAVTDYAIVIAAAPFWLAVVMVVAAVIKINEPGESVFFKQKRIGRFGRPFNCYKFRSMHKNWRKILDDYLERNPAEVRHFAKFHKYEFDPRITKVGGFIRRTSLDELPQLFNVLRLEMSLVGPRPYMFYEKRQIGKNLGKITRVRPGLTGLWQVSGRNEISFDDRVQIDCKYVENLSVWGDIKILFKTIGIVLNG